MDRTFHSKVDWWYWLLMAVTAFLLFDFFWFHYTIATLLVAAVMTRWLLAISRSKTAPLTTVYCPAAAAPGVDLRVAEVKSVG